MIQILKFATLLFFFLITWGASEARADDPSGVWLTQAGDAQVAVARCGSGLCGRIIWLRDPIDKATGKRQVDDKNPNPRLASRAVVGINLFTDMKEFGPGKWVGKIYNADDGRLYASEVTLPRPDLLVVKGCAGPFCGEENWSRVPGR